MKQLHAASRDAVLLQYVAQEVAVQPVNRVALRHGDDVLLQELHQLGRTSGHGFLPTTGTGSWSAFRSCMRRPCSGTARPTTFIILPRSAAVLPLSTMELDLAAQTPHAPAAPLAGVDSTLPVSRRPWPAAPLARARAPEPPITPARRTPAGAAPAPLLTSPELTTSDAAACPARTFFSCLATAGKGNLFTKPGPGNTNRGSTVDDVVR